MIRIQVLGSGCRSCSLLYENVLLAVKAAGLADYAAVEQVQDIDLFLKLGVFVTPSLVVDGRVVSVGKVLPVEEILALLKQQGSA